MMSVFNVMKIDEIKKYLKHGDLARVATEMNIKHHVVRDAVRKGRTDSLIVSVLRKLAEKRKTQAEEIAERIFSYSN